MSSTLCIDPLLLSSGSTAAPWQTAAHHRSPPAEFPTFLSSLSDVSWEDVLDQMQLDPIEPIQPRLFSPDHGTAAAAAAVVPKPETTSPASIPSPPESTRGSQHRKPRPRVSSHHEPHKPHKPHKSHETPSPRPEAASGQHTLGSDGWRAVPCKAERGPSPTHSVADNGESVLSGDESEAGTVTSPTARSSLTQRQRNRLAASKSRRKKDTAVKQLERDERIIAQQHDHLLAHVATLDAQVLTLKSLLLEHQSCNCNNIRNYLAFQEPD